MLPSTTEILFAIGAGDDVVGVTFECDEPAHARSTRTVVSHTTLPPGLSPAEIDRVVRDRLAAGEDLYTLDEGALRALDPDVVVTQDLCAVCAVDVTAVDDALAYLGCAADVVTVDPMSLSEVIESISRLGSITGHREEAERLTVSLRHRIDAVAAATAGRRPMRVTVLEWTDPPFTAGHWLPDMVTIAGGIPGLGAPGARSASVSWATVAASRPELVVIAPCGFRLDGAARLASDVVERHLLPVGVPVWAVDADAAFVRPGPRLVDGIEALAGILHPEAVARRAELAVEVPIVGARLS